MVWLLWLPGPGPSLGLAQESRRDSGAEVFDFTDAVQPAASPAQEGLPWIRGVLASHYGGGRSSCWGGYGNQLHPDRDFFCALPATEDCLDCLGGQLACRISRCDAAQPTLDELLGVPLEEIMPAEEGFDFWPGSGPTLGETYGWVIEGAEGDGLFRLIEIKPSGEDWPILEAYVGDVGPWGNSDPYWVHSERPDAEDGTSTRGRRTNRAGIDLSYALACELGFTGLMEVDWRWKTVDGAYVVRRQPTEWRW